MSGPVDTLGARFVRAILEANEAGVGRRTFAALIRASDSPFVCRRLEQSMELDLFAPLAARLSGPDAELRARVFAAQAQGLMTILWIVEDTKTAGADPVGLVTHDGRALQSTLDDSEPRE